MYIHRNFTHPGGVSPMKQEDNFPDPNRSIKAQVEEREEEKTPKKKEEVKEKKVEEKKVVHTPPPQDNSKQGVIKQGKAPAWYENLFQSDDKGRELSDKEKKEEKYALPSTPTWSKFENSKVGKAIDAKGIVKEKDGLMELLGYGKGEEKDLAMDVGAVFHPGVDVGHAVSKAAEGKYLDAGLYALFAAVPGTAGPLVNKAKKLLGVGDKVGAEKLLKETIKNNENAIKTNLKPKGGVGGGKIKVDNEYKHVEFPTGTDPRNVTNAISTRGTDLDVFMKGGKGSYTIKDITKLPSNSGREMVKVKLPDGGEQVFYKSSGGGKKAGSQGEWIPYEGTTNGGWFVKTGSEGTFHGKPIKTIFTEDKTSHGVYEQIKKLGLDPWEEIEKGTLKIDQWGQGFKYGSKEYGNIAEQLSKMNL